MQNILRISTLYAFLLYAFSCAAQKELATTKIKKELTWRDVAVKMPEDWYGSVESKRIADSVLTYQTDIGGWSKNRDYVKGFDKEEWDKIKSSGIGATFDNGATLTEMQFLTKMYNKVKDERYLNAFNKGFNYILEAQYANGGWPQFYPVRPGRVISYSAHITYNDNAMVNVVEFLKDVEEDQSYYAPMNISSKMKEDAKKSFEKGVDCILKTQIKVKKQRTVWCAQHDEVTMEPANARAYELSSFSGFESVGITLLLMKIDNPSKEIIDAVKGSVSWFQNHKVVGIKLRDILNAEGKKDKVVVEDIDAPALWARFYDLETELPYFCDRDGIKRKTFAELGYERRNGYSWYTAAPERLLKHYPEWAKKWNVN